MSIKKYLKRTTIVVPHAWRRGRDSNPRGDLRPPIDLANRPLQPLGYLSTSSRTPIPHFTDSAKASAYGLRSSSQFYERDNYLSRKIVTLTLSGLPLFEDKQ
jgi:hypothetical protein